MTGKNIVILGDTPLVEEYRILCNEKGYSSQPSSNVALALELTNISLETKKKNLLQLDDTLPKTIPILSSSVTVMLTEQATWVKHPSRLVGICAFPTLLQNALVEFAVSHQTSEAAKTAAIEFSSSLGKEHAFVQDSIGFVMPRILCMLANEASFAMMEGVAEAQDIDTAMKLGTNYPNGPVQWAEQIGVQQVHAVVSALYRYFGEDRYRPAPLLQKAALTGRLEG